MNVSGRWQTRTHASRAERGAAAVEFAIVLTVLLLILLGIIDFGRLLYVSQGVKAASREGARVAAVRTAWGAAGNPTTNPTSSATGVVAAVKSAADSASSLAAGGSLKVANDKGTSADLATESPCTTAGGSVTVTVTVLFKWITPVGALPGLSSGALQGSRDVTSATTMRCE